MKTFAAALLAPLLALALAAPAVAQPVPKTRDGHPDLSGAWSNVSLTKLERPGNLKGPTMTEAEATALAANDPLRRAAEADRKPSDPNAGALAPGGALGHDAVFLDGGETYAKIRGEYRTAWIVDPADGRMPLTELGQRRKREAAAMSNRMDPAGPEDLAPNDRCLIGSRNSGGPGMLNNIYNSNYQFLLTRDALVVIVEMGFGVRIIPIHADRAAAQAAHQPATLARWMGDSTAWWEGPTLVVETVDVRDEQGRFGPIFLSEKGRVTERLTRSSKDEIAYEFSVEDPVHYTRPWRAEMVMTALPGRIYEYACHEGNYALPGILGGARAAEAEATKATPSGGGR
ncbi:MAG: hypothetical protein JNL41_04665 [Phenylobacterium sp.]|uniref:hypothetical protein n=1 Tax=Phenylobacterium sp. TaxID=1871053 RepID=UPI001A5A7B32|nr:hypothetical protein [Phenylobacterium sp.]MBL8553549.1 hypothetical protein [Phenylobacterium sp.]